MSFEDQVRERAYQIWLAGGMADGLAHEHWTMAEAAVKAEPVVILTKAAKTKVAAKTKTVVKTKTAAKPAAKTTAKKAVKQDAIAAH